MWATSLETIMRLTNSRALAAMLCSLIATTTFASPADPTGIEVTGEGTVEVDADQATVIFVARNDNASGVIAYGQTQQIARRLIETARAQGIADDDLEASGIALQTEYRPRDETRTPRFIATATVTTVVRALDKVDELMDAMVKAGALVNGSPQPGLAEPDKVRDEAIELAVTDARRQAEQAARLLGVRLGAARRVVVHGSGGRPDPAVRMAKEGSDSSTVVPGKIPVSQTVNVTFNISD
jgi:uncharacterized protein YggE